MPAVSCEERNRSGEMRNAKIKGEAARTKKM